MSRNRRLSSVLHGLIHLAETPGPPTSQELARAMQTHPVAVRRDLGRLRERGFVRSEKGHGGGWSIDCDLARVTLFDVYEALGSPQLFAMQNKNAEPRCLMEQVVNAALDSSFRQAEVLLLESMRNVSLASLIEDFRRRFEVLGLGPFDAMRHVPDRTRAGCTDEGVAVTRRNE